ncbi:hypothetical protein FRB90_007774, partial [Tulasnella sp. 427]
MSSETPSDALASPNSTSRSAAAVRTDVNSHPDYFASLPSTSSRSPPSLHSAPKTIQAGGKERTIQAGN